MIKENSHINNTIAQRILLVTLWSLLLLIPFDAFAIERRQAQFKSDSSYLILPLPISVPGIGQMVVFTGLAANIADTNLDLAAMKAVGDAEGYMLWLSDLHLISETLILEYYHSSVSKSAITNHSERGMDTQKDDYTILGINQQEEDFGSIRLSLFDRRFELFTEYVRGSSTINKIMDNEGNVQTEFENPSAQSTEKTTTGILIDYTDDYLDARKGVRLHIQRSHSPRTDDNASDFYIIDKELEIYIPIGDYSVWAFHAMTSDAEVTKTGVTDPDKIADELGLSCNYDVCTQDEKNLIDHKIVERKNGTVEALGGMDRLRSYPENRFQGAHVRYFSTEFRFNFANKVTPFNFWIWKDISTSIQWAFFYDLGTIAESQEDLWKKSAYSVGTGLRMITASGNVYRADWATGKEGSELTVIFEYPW